MLGTIRAHFPRFVQQKMMILIDNVKCGEPGEVKPCVLSAAFEKE